MATETSGLCCLPCDGLPALSSVIGRLADRLPAVEPVICSPAGYKRREEADSRIVACSSD